MNKAYQAYSRASHTVPKTKQIVMLYDGIIRNLQQAKEAMEQTNIEQRYNKLVKSSEIIIGLQSCLDYDQGQEAAQILYDFYSSLDSRIIGLHRTNDTIACQQLIDEVKEMREMWHNIDQGQIDDAPEQVDASDSPSIATAGIVPQSDGPASVSSEPMQAEATDAQTNDGSGSGVVVSA